jgi:triosephosphate isomerase (TIM)
LVAVAGNYVKQIVKRQSQSFHQKDNQMGTGTHWIIGNWKMNGTSADGTRIVADLTEKLAEDALALKPTTQLAICPPFTWLSNAADLLSDSLIRVGGQDCHGEDKGAFTGSISAAMLKDVGAGLCLIGHSERRHGLQESDELIAGKLQACLHHDLIAVLCIGETLAERQGAQVEAVLRQQLTKGLPGGLGDCASLVGKVIIAYEPVWAIGTGLTATTQQIAETHGFIKSLFGGAGALPVLYGGSVKASNAAEIMALAEVDGVLVGGASLNPTEFWQIACSA